MGQNFSKAVNVNGDTISGPDRFAEVVLGIAWAGSLYGIGMIFCTVALLGRWAGPHGERGFNFFSIIAAFLMSTAWPLVMLYLAMQGR